MKKYYLVLFVILISAAAGFGQSIYVAESVTENGEAIGAKNVWDIDPWGRSLYIVYDNGGQINDDILYLFIDKFIDGKFQPFDSKVIEVKKPVSRIKYDYKFKDTGKFKVYIVNEKEETLSSLLLTLRTKTGESNKAEKSDNYYDGISMIFCEKVLVGGTPLGIVRSVSLSRNSGSVYIKISHYAPLNTNTILVDVWRKGNNSYDYDEYVESKKYKVDPTWRDTFFKYKFYKQGRYKIIIYNEYDAIIKTGYITVTN